MTWTQTALILAAPVALFALIYLVPLSLDALRPSSRAVARKLRQPGALVKCGCPGREPSPIFGDQTVHTRNALETETAIARLQSHGCARVLVIDGKGAAAVAMPPGPVTEYYP